MKKLMTVCAACMVAGMAAAQVESQNIVGYQTIGLNSGFTAVMPSFIDVGDINGALTFGDIQGTFADFDSLQFFNADGSVAAVYSWFLGEWIDSGFASVMDVTLPSGGFFVSTATAPEIVIAGQVDTAIKTVNLNQGFTCLGNPKAYEITFGDIVPTNLVDFDSIQFFNADGSVAAVYSWFLGGWIDSGFASVMDTPIPAASGFFVSTSASNASLEFPAL